MIAVAAWLLGAATATCGSLLAVSLLGDGFGVTGASGQQLTVAAVNKALADATPGRLTSPSPSGTLPTPDRAAHSASARPAPTPDPTPPPSSLAGTGTLLTSPAGTAVATCEPAGVYLLSWSPAQGYGVDHVVRGPAAAASVVFDAGTRALTMRVVCRSGTPVSDATWGRDDDGASPGPDE